MWHRLQVIFVLSHSHTRLDHLHYVAENGETAECPVPCHPNLDRDVLNAGRTAQMLPARLVFVLEKVKTIFLTPLKVIRVRLVTANVDRHALLIRTH